MFRATLCILLAGCGPVAIGGGLSKLFKNGSADVISPVVEILSSDQDPPREDFGVTDAVAPFLVRTNKGNVALRAFVELEPFVAVSDVNGCPRDAGRDLIELFGYDLDAVQPLPGGAFATDVVVDPASLGFDPAQAFTVAARLWVRGQDPQGRIVCVNHTLRIDHEAPAPPQGAVADAIAPHEIRVSWTPSAETDVTGYRVLWDAPPTDRTPADVMHVPGVFNFRTDPDAPPPDTAQTATGLVVDGRLQDHASIKGLFALRPHFVTVHAVDRAGNLSPLTQALEVRTRAGGDGRFLAAVDSGLRGPVAIADFNRDLRQDLVAVRCDISPPAAVLTFRLLQADGTFLTRNIPIDDLCQDQSDNPVFVATGDFDKDGNPDVAAAFLARTEVFLLGAPDASGTPTLKSVSTQQYSFSRTPLGCAVEDMDRDGRPDVVSVFEFPIAGQLDPVTTFSFDRGAFTSASITPVPLGSDARDFAIGDFNGDQIPDVAIADTGGVAVALRDPTSGGTTGVPVTRRITTNGAPGGLVAGHFNADTFLDLAVANLDGTVLVLAGKGDGTFTRLAGENVGATGPIAGGDFNGDAILDLAVLRANDVLLLAGDGTGRFTAAGSLTVPTVPSFIPSGISAIDMDGDRILDLVVNGALLTGRGATGTGLDGFVEQPALDTGRFVIPSGFGFVSGRSFLTVETLDVNRDAVADLAVGVSIDGTSGSLVLYRGVGTRGQGSARFASPVSFAGVGVEPVRQIVAGDFDGDGVPDVVSVLRDLLPGSPPAYPTFYPGRVDEGFGEALAVAGPPDHPATDVVAGDLDADGLVDFVTVNLNGSGPRLLDAWFSPQPLGLATDVWQGAGGFRSTPALGDFDGNGLLDIAISDVSVGGDFFVLLAQRAPDQSASRSFAAPVATTAGAYGAATAVDVDRDGMDDLLTLDRGTFIVWHSDSAASPATFVKQQEVTVGDGESIEAADFNGDGVPDVLVAGKVLFGLKDSRNEPTGQFSDPLDVGVTAPLGYETKAFAIADFNADGLPDVAVADNVTGKVRIFLARGFVRDR